MCYVDKDSIRLGILSSVSSPPDLILTIGGVQVLDLFSFLFGGFFVSHDLGPSILHLFLPFVGCFVLLMAGFHHCESP